MADRGKWLQSWASGSRLLTFVVAGEGKWLQVKVSSSKLVYLVIGDGTW